MEQVLEKLLESVPKARLLRIFVRNPELFFSFKDLVKRSRVRPALVRRELNKFLKIGIVSDKNGNSGKRKGKKQVYFAEQRFKLFPELKELITKDIVAPRQKLILKVKTLGNVKLVILSGVFLNTEKSRTDLLIVGDGIKKSKLEHFLAELESEIGRAVQYTLMDTKEYKYRLNMYDRFLRDIMEFPHEKLINKLKI